MRADIVSITPVIPHDVGDRRFEFRVELSLGEATATVDVTAAQLLTHDEFQQAVLATTGRLCSFGLSTAVSEFDLQRSWRGLVEQADWRGDLNISYDAERARRIMEDEDDQPIRFADD